MSLKVTVMHLEIYNSDGVMSLMTESLMNQNAILMSPKFKSMEIIHTGQKLWNLQC